MIEKQLAGVEFIAANTDAQALKQSKASRKLQLGELQLQRDQLADGGDEWLVDGKEADITHPLSFALADMEMCLNQIDGTLRMPMENLHLPK